MTTTTLKKSAIKPGARIFQSAHPEYGIWTILRHYASTTWEVRGRSGTITVCESELAKFWQPEGTPVPYAVGTLRAASLEAKWGRTSAGAPIIFARKPDAEKKTWFAVDRKMWQAAQSEGIGAAFARFTLLGDFFSIPA